MNDFYRRIIKSLLFLCLFQLTCFGLFAEQEPWKEALLKDGKTEVSYRISERNSGSGKQVPMIEFSARTVESVDFERCIALMKDFTKHNYLMDAETSEMIRTLSDREWLLYYYYPSSGPISASDAVMRFSFSRIGDTAEFTLTAEPDLMEDRGVKRAFYDEETYRFRDMGNGQVELEIHVSTIPPVSVPKWLLKLAFPEAAGDTLKKIIEEVQS